MDNLFYLEQIFFGSSFFRPKQVLAAFDFLFFGFILAVHLFFLAAYLFRKKDARLLIFSILGLVASFLYIVPDTLSIAVTATKFDYTFTINFHLILFAAFYILLAVFVDKMTKDAIPRPHLFLLAYIASFLSLALIASHGAVYSGMLLALGSFLLLVAGRLLFIVVKTPGPRDLRVGIGFGLLIFPLGVATRLAAHATGLEIIDAPYFCLVIFTGAVAFLMLKDVLIACGNLENDVASYERFVPQEFLNLLQKTISDVKVGDSTELAMSILFADIRDFTTLSEQMTPDENFKFVNSYCEIMDEIIKKNGGFIDKFIGDAIMALFTGTADGAIKCSIEMLQRLEEYNEGRIRAGYLPIKIGVGVNAGILRLGAVGDVARIQGTVIGDAVNIASRLESMTKVYGVSILISDSVYSLLMDPSKYLLRKVGTIRVKGKKETVKAWEVFNRDNSEMQKHKIMVADVFNDAVKLFDERSYEDALILFQNCVANNENDTTSLYYLDKCKLFLDMNRSGGHEGIARVVRYERLID